VLLSDSAVTLLSVFNGLKIFFLGGCSITLTCVRVEAAEGTKPSEVDEETLASLYMSMGETDLPICLKQPFSADRKQNAAHVRGG
jgi:hypothetical protein